MTNKTTNASSSNATEMGNGHKKLPTGSVSADDLAKNASESSTNKDVAKWTSHEVQHWIKQQSKKFELKKATAEKFEMNGQALVLLTKHDFLRRSPDGGEILYYALQRLINPNKVNSTRFNKSSSRNGSSGQHPRIVEVIGDDGLNGVTDSSSPQPIVEEPDDPPINRRSQSDTNFQGHQHHHQQRSHPFGFHPAHISQPVFTMDAGSAAAYFQQQRGFPNTSMFAQHPHLHMHQQHFAHPHFMHQYHPMMSAQGILIEVVDDADQTNPTPDAANSDGLYMVTVNGQRYVMTEEQVIQFVANVHQRQAYQENLQRQQQFQQQQQLFQQQAQQQQQQFFQQQAPQPRF